MWAKPDYNNLYGPTLNPFNVSGISDLIGRGTTIPSMTARGKVLGTWLIRYRRRWCKEAARPVKPLSSP